MNIFRWISDATNPRDRRRRQEARYRRDYQTNPPYRYSPPPWSEPLQNWPVHNKATTSEDNPRIVFVSPEPDTTSDHRRHHRRRRHERTESLTTDVLRHPPYIPRYRSPYTDAQNYTPWYPTRQFSNSNMMTPANSPTCLRTNTTPQDDPNIHRTAEASYPQVEQDRDRRGIREINRLTEDLRSDDFDDAQRDRRRGYGRALEGEYLGTEPNWQARNHLAQLAIRNRIAQLEADIRERESRRIRHNIQDWEARATSRPELGDDVGNMDNILRNYHRPGSDDICRSHPVSISRGPSRWDSYSSGYLRPRVRFSPTASCYRDVTPREGYESSGSEEVYYDDLR